MSYFASKKQASLQQINLELQKLLGKIDTLNSRLNDSLTLAHQFNNISTLWNTFYSTQLQTELLFESQDKQNNKIENDSNSNTGSASNCLQDNIDDDAIDQDQVETQESYSDLQPKAYLSEKKKS